MTDRAADRTADIIFVVLEIITAGLCIECICWWWSLTTVLEMTQ
jgi:hypothetical protein